MSGKTNFPLCLHNEEFVRHLERNLLRQVNELVLTQSLISYIPCLTSVTVVFSLSFSYIPLYLQRVQEINTNFSHNMNELAPRAL